VTGPVTCPGIGGTPTQQLGIALADDEIQSAIADGSADIVSLSYGLAEADALGFYYDASGNGFGPTEFAALAAQGVAIFVSSGDNGAQGCATSSAQPNPDALCVSYPATDPSVVSAGGVNTPLDSAGHLTGPITGWGQQTENPASPGGSGGGCSLTFEAPAYEAGLSPADPCAGKRSQPDASLDADLNTGVATVVDADPSLGGRLVAAVGGTSVAAPEMAAMWALVLQACKAAPSCGNGPGAYPYRLGNPNYYYYPIYRAGTSGAIPPGGKKFTPALPYSQVFYDVLYGANGLPSQSGSGFAPGFSAGPGLDLVTGLGAPYGRNLIHAVTGI